MADQVDFWHDPRGWISLLALAVSGCSAIFSLRSSRISARALALNERQESRRQPQLGIYIANGYRRLQSERQLFGFLVSIANPTDINNSIARAELLITYTTESGVTVSCRITHDSALAETDESNASILSLPVRVDAHQTIAGWFLFALPHSIIKKGSVDAHHLILEDTHGVETDTDSIMVREWVDETKNS